MRNRKNIISTHLQNPSLQRNQEKARKMGRRMGEQPT